MIWFMDQERLTMTDAPVMSKSELLGKMQDGWNNFSAYAKSLSVDQLTKPKDAVGWTARDHLVHLVAWEDGTTALLDQQSQRDVMHVDEATWKTGDFDKINAVIQQHYKDVALEGVLKMLEEAHHRLFSKVQSMSDADLQLPYKHFAPHSQRENPIIGWIQGNSYDHYAEHRPWIEAIVAGKN
jgi:hypothetical protein